jgi:hypothetical protein
MTDANDWASPAPANDWVDVPHDTPIMERLGSPRQVNLGVRSVLKGLASPAYLGADLLTGGANLAIKGVNAVTGSDISPATFPSVGEDRTLNMWFGEPEGLELPGARATEFAASVPAMAGTAAASGVRALAPLAQDLGPQLVGAATGGAASGAAGAVLPPSPWKPWLETAAGLIGGAAGGLTVAPRPGPTATMDAFERSGIAPSAGDVTQAPGVQLVQKVVAPLASDTTDLLPGTYVANQETARLAQAQRAAEGLAQRYGTPQTNVQAGQTMQRGVQDYRYGAPPPGMTPGQIIRAPTWQTSIAAKADALYQRINVPDDATIPVPNASQALAQITSRYANPELQQALGDQTIARWSDILNRSNGQLTWSDLRNLRTDVRYLRNNPSLTATIDDRALAQLNDALTQDMRAGAFHIGGASAEQAVTRADNYYSAAMGSVNRGLNSVFKAATPEDAYAQFERALGSTARGDVGKVNALRRVLGPDEWGDLVATWLSRAGMPKGSQAGIPGQPTFSVESFLTNYSNLSPTARQLMFNSTGQSQLRSSLDDLTRALGAMRGTDRMASNPSKSAQQGIAAATIAGLWKAPLTTMSAIGGANLTARALYNPFFIRLMATGVRATRTGTPAQFMAQAARVVQSDPALAQDVQNLTQTLFRPTAAAAPGATPDNRGQGNRQRP